MASLTLRTHGLESTEGFRPGHIELSGFSNPPGAVAWSAMVLENRKFLYIMFYKLILVLLFSPPLGDQQSKGGRMQIELDVFSGRPNPTWALNDEEAKEFLSKFKLLTVSDSDKPLYDGLGYRGFKATGFQDYDAVRVWNGIVEATRGEKTSRWNDRGKSLEKYLLRIAKDHIDEGIYKVVESAIDKN
jgi:hypothetical protein